MDYIRDPDRLEAGGRLIQKCGGKKMYMRVMVCEL